MSSIVRFNRKFSQAQLTAAEGLSQINGVNVVNGSWYIAKTNATALYVGSLEGGETAVLKKVSDIAGGDIAELNSYISKAASGATTAAATSRSAAAQVVSGIAISESAGKLVDSSSSVTSLRVDAYGAADQAYKDAVATASSSLSSSIAGLSSSVSASASSSAAATAYTDKVDVVSGISVTQSNGKLTTASVVSTKADKAGAAALAYSASLSESKAYTDNTISGLDATITKSASGATTAAATSASAAAQVVSGITIAEYDGKLVADSSSVTSVRVDAYGAASAAYSASLSESKAYTDNLVSQSISDLGTIMHFQGTKATINEIKAIAPAKAGDVWVCTADGSEWVCTEDISVATAGAWEKFGTTDVSGALYKGANAFTSGSFVIADGTDGKMKVISDADMASRIESQSVFKTKQTAIRDSGSGYVSAVEQNENGEVSVYKTALPNDFGVLKVGTTTVSAGSTADTASFTGSGTVTVALDSLNKTVTISGSAHPEGSGTIGTASSATDAWKTVVHDASLSSAHVLSGNTKSIPAAAAGSSSAASTDGYMTGAQAYKLSGIADGAEVNQNAFSSIVVGTESIDAESKTDSFRFESLRNISLGIARPIFESDDKPMVTIASPDVSGSVSGSSWKNPVTYIAGVNHGISGSTGTIPAATTGSDGYMSSSSVINLNTAILALTWDE